VGMIVRKGIIRRGQVVVEEPIDLPDGSEVTVVGRSRNEAPSTRENGPGTTVDDAALTRSKKRLAEAEFMAEDEQGDGPEEIERWIDELRSIPHVPENPEKEAEWRAWEGTMRQFNIEAMRRQFQTGTP
jgi:hypothetical protein